MLMEYVRAPNELPHFSTVFQTATPPQIVKTFRLFIDNRDRHEGTPFDFKVKFGSATATQPTISNSITPYENIQSMELRGVAFPKIANEPYVILSIEELNDDMLDATCPAAHRAYAIIYFDTDALAPGVIKPLKGVDFYQKLVKFKPPISRLNRLSIKFLKYDGSIVTTTDTNNVNSATLMFEVTTGTRCN